MGSDNPWYQDLFYKNPLSMVIFDDESLRILKANEAAADLYGYSLEELCTLRITDLRAPESREPLRRLLRNTSRERVSGFEARHTTKDGTTIDVQITSYPIVYGQTSARISQILNITDKKQLQERVRKEGNRFASLIRNSEDIIAVTNQEGMITYVSPAFTTKTGFDTEEVINKPAAPILYPDDLQHPSGLKPELLAPGGMLRRRNRILCRDGSYLWVEGTETNLLHDEAVRGFVSNFRDIGDRVEAENTIREIERNLRAVFESAVEGFIVTDDQLFIKSFNPKARELFFGQRRENMLETGRNLMEYVEPERRQFFSEQIRKVLAGEVVEYDRKHDTATGPQWLGYAIYPVTEEERITRICIVARDQTKTIQAEEQLKNSEHLFKTLVQEGSDLINVVDFEGNYKYLSQSLNSVLSSKAAEFLGKNAFDLVHPDDRARLHEEFQALRTVKRATSSPYRFHVGNGNYRWIETAATNLMDEPGIEGIVINSHDITDTIDHLRSIEQQNERLQEIAWLQAHKVRAPLSSILGIINLFAEDLDPAQVRELLHLLKQSAVQLDEIIREIIERSHTGIREHDSPSAAQR